MGFINQPSLTVFADSAFLQNKQTQNFTLEPTLLAAQLSEVKLHLNVTENATEIPLKTGVNGTLICWQNLTIYTLNKPLRTNLKTPLKIDVLVLQKNVYVTPEKLKANFNPAIIVFDSSNEGWYVRWLGAKLTQSQLPFHDVNTQGAFVKLPLKQGFN